MAVKRKQKQPPRKNVMLRVSQETLIIVQRVKSRISDERADGRIVTNHDAVREACEVYLNG